MWMFGLIIIALAGSSAWGQATVCPAVDLQAAKDSPFNKIPTYDQDGTGLCYAYAAAQATDYYLLSHGAGGIGNVEPVYAAWLAGYKAHYKMFRRDDLGGGLPQDVMNALRDYGSCKSRDVSAGLESLKGSAHFTNAQALHFLETMFSAYEKNSGFFSRPNPGSKWKEGGLQDAEFELRIPSCTLKAAESYLQAKSLLGISSTAVLESLFGRCKPKRLNLPKVRDVGVRNNLGRASQEISLALSKKQPAVLSIQCASSMFDHPAKTRSVVESSWIFGHTLISKSAKECPEKDDGAHAVLIAGQKMIHGACHYLIRNSWGSFWRGSGATQCSCRTYSGEYKDNCAFDEVQKFKGCWYKKSDVIANTIGVQSYE